MRGGQTAAKANRVPLLAAEHVEVAGGDIAFGRVTGKAANRLLVGLDRFCVVPGGEMSVRESGSAGRRRAATI
jgi:hypothetical protein